LHRQNVPLNEIVIVAPTWRDVIHLAREIKKIDPDIPLDSPSVSPIPRSVDNYWYDLIRLYFTPISAESYSKRRRIAQRVLDNLFDLGFVFVGDQISIKNILKVVNTIKLDFGLRISEFVDSLILQFCSIFQLDITSVVTAQEAKRVLLSSIEERLAQYGLNDNAGSIKEYYRDKNGISMSTYYQTKGEEYELVVVSGLLHGKVPHWGVIYDKSISEDYIARRLLYVISSRAKRYLYMISETGHTTRRGDLLVPTYQLTRCIP
jgi:hypothetical protein